MARNLDEPGANFDQLLELALNLKNARAFAGKNGDYDWKEGDWTDPEDVDLYDWEPKPVIQEPRTTAQGTYGRYAAQIASGGRVGLRAGTTTLPYLSRGWSQPGVYKAPRGFTGMEEILAGSALGAAASAFSKDKDKPVTKKTKESKTPETTPPEDKGPDIVSEIIAETAIEKYLEELDKRIMDEMDLTKSEMDNMSSTALDDLRRNADPQGMQKHFDEITEGRGVGDFPDDPFKHEDILPSLEDFDVKGRKKNASGGRIGSAQGTYGKFAQQIASGGRVGFENGGDVSSQLMSWLLSPKNLERLRNNKDLVRKLTKNKMLPSSVRLYLRNLAGVTDKITEDFFSKSELKEIKRRVTEAKAMGSMGYASSSGITDKTLSSQKKDDGVIGYSWGAEPMSIKGAFTSPESNIDMTLGQATFSKDEKGNFIVKDVHDFHGVEGSGYAEPKGAYSDYKGEYRPLRFPERQEGESDKQLLKRAKKALEAGNIGSAKYARIIAGLKQEEGIPVELNIGKITQEDKYKAERDFAKYIAQDTKSGYGVEYEDVGIPSKIRKHAKKYGL